MLDDKSKISALPTFDGEYSANLDSVVIREPMPCEDRIREPSFLAVARRVLLLDSRGRTR